MCRYTLITFLLLISISCSQSISIDGFDSETWIRDVDGCKGDRKILVELLDKQKDVLLGKDQDQIIELLGKPDVHEIYKRSQTFFIYSIDPGSSCSNYVTNKTLAKLTLRYNALGRIHEVFYYR